MNIEKIRSELVDFIKEFEEDYHKHRGQLEANTETKLIEPLFAILGWTPKDFTKREQVRRGNRTGFVDYSFSIGGKEVFFLEVKRLGLPLEREADTQVISYALSRTNVPFAISTNFEKMKVFCVEQENPLTNIFRVFSSPGDYINNLQDLLYLHKESFEQNLLLRKAEEEGRLKKRISIDKPLLEGLMTIRRLIANDIERRYPKKYNLDEREEIIQRIIDRLIFIRKCEDVGINLEGISLMEKIVHDTYGNAYYRLKEIFKKYNEVYNGGLFAIGTDNDCDVINIDGKIVQEMVTLLYTSKDKQYVYNFDWINADILGQVYEQYLGKILAQTKSGKTSLMNGVTYRKEQGIYYTPTYIVEYIVDSTLGEILNAKDSSKRNIKIIDPACGSGSFLIKAFDRLIAKLYKDDEVRQHRIDEQGKYTFKTEILKNNLYGVDLDEKAVEITKLNLLLKAAEKYRKLPSEVDLRIKHGNSLIQNENIAGLNAFKWEERFSEVTAAGGFDVVVGNPPYIDSEEMSRSQPETREECRTIYECAKGNWDLFCVFLEKGIKLLKDGGYLGMIVPNKLLSADYAEQTRKFLAKYSVKIIRDYSKVPVFNASVYPIVIVVQKSKPLRSNTKVEVIELKNDVPVVVSSKVVNYSELTKGENRSWSHILPNAYAGGVMSIGKTQKLGDIAQIFGAATVSEAYEFKKIIRERTEEDSNYYKFVNTGTIDRYSCLWGVFKTRYIKETYNRPIIDRGQLEHFSKKRYEQANLSKIIVGGMTKRLECYLDSGYCLAGKSTTIIVSKDDLRPILAILNSKFMSSYYRTMFSALSLSGGYMRVGPPQINELQIKMSDEFKKEVVPLVDRITVLNREINELGIKHTERRARLEEEIQRTDRSIDILVYKLYGITDEQKELIEKEITF